MWNWFWKQPQPPPPVVLVPPLFDFPPISARTRMLETSYNVLFGKLALKCLFDDYYYQARHFTTRIMLKPIDDPHVDLIATVSINFILLRAHWFQALLIIRKKRTLQEMRYFAGKEYVVDKVNQFFRVGSDESGMMGLRYGSGNLSFGVTLLPFATKDELPKTAWLVSRMGRMTAGVQYEPQHGNAKLSNLMNWSCAMSYGVGSGSPLSPSFNFGLELVKSTQFVASFYQHMVVQRRVKNPLEQNSVVGITNYIDFGFELQTSVDDAIAANNISDSTFQIGASWQANKNFLLKAKVGPSSSSLALAFKSWWKPSFTFSISGAYSGIFLFNHAYVPFACVLYWIWATRDRADGKVQFGFGIQSESLREASYQRADPNFVMLTPSKEHLAEGIVWETGKRPMLQSDINAGHFDGLPREMRPLDKFL
ncbi:hypothetical protein Ahy_B05g075770 isoform B [Arachis hypogaea]|uniref:Uncharacterized protein n=1 Tax=Arachis hypogaea TaxID=3818 RepID=A0A444Z200_ARAHY|nr:hypothetical protein Ahy_B05g075770 isoform B [Arachis hypogaea]